MDGSFHGTLENAGGAKVIRDVAIDGFVVKTSPERSVFGRIGKGPKHVAIGFSPSAAYSTGRVVSVQDRTVAFELYDRAEIVWTTGP